MDRANDSAAAESGRCGEAFLSLGVVVSAYLGLKLLDILGIQLRREMPESFNNVSRSEVLL
jgi:hypothetical protein